MSATTTVHVRDLLPGDVVVVSRATRFSLAETKNRGGLCLLVDDQGQGRIAHGDAKVQIACADVPPIREVLDA